MKKFFNNSGISLLEVVVAISIIAIGLMGVSSLVIQNIQAQYINKNMLVASGLAQEGLELVRNIRDLNWLKPGHDWKLGAGVGSNSDIVQDGDYLVDYNYDITDVDGLGNARLYLDANNLYTHVSGATTTNFYRLITVDNSQPEYLDVQCTIRWQDSGQNHDYTAKTYLYNWR